MNILILDNCAWLNEYCKELFFKEDHDVIYDDYTFYLNILKMKGQSLDFVFINVNPYDTKHIVNVVQSIYTYAPIAHIVILSIDWKSPIINSLIAKGCTHIAIPFEPEELQNVLQKNNLYVH